MSIDRSARLAHLDGLRAVSILLVLGYHLAPTAVRAGYLGVDVFFVISGYLITGLLRRDLEAGSLRAAAFYARRVRRLFPALITVLAATVAAGAALLVPAELGALGRHVVAGAGFASNLVLWGEAGYFDDALAEKPLMHLWSLGIEEQFYLLWPWLVAALWWVRSTGGRLSWALLVLMVAASFATSAWLTTTDATAAFYAPWSRFWELGVGAALAWRAGEATVGPAAPSPGQDGVAAVGLALIAGTALAWPGDWGAPAGAALGPVVGAAMVVAAGRDAWVSRRLLSTPALVGLGELSYALYLWHWPLLSFAGLAHGGPLPGVARATIGAASLVLAWATVRWIERPVLAREPGVALVAGLSAALLSVGAMGGLIVASGGLPSRYPPELRSLVAFPATPEWREGDGCFLQPEQDATQVGEVCVDRDRRPLVLLWGDSHAAALYPGLKRLAAAQGFGVGELTASRCPPIVDYDQSYYPLCPSVNEAVVAKIQALRPEVVVLHSAWKDDLTGLGRTVAALHAWGVARVVVVGPVPAWHRELYRLVGDYSRTDWRRPLIPSVTRFGLTQDFIDGRIDAPLVDALRGADVVFVSARDALCGAEGCLARVGPGAGELTAFDRVHLSEAGSIALWARIATQVFGPTGGPEVTPTR